MHGTLTCGDGNMIASQGPDLRKRREGAALFDQRAEDPSVARVSPPARPQHRADDHRHGHGASQAARTPSVTPDLGRADRARSVIGPKIAAGRLPGPFALLAAVVR